MPLSVYCLTKGKCKKKKDSWIFLRKTNNEQLKLLIK